MKTAEEILADIIDNFSVSEDGTVNWIWMEDVPLNPETSKDLVEYADANKIDFSYDGR